MSEDPWGTWFGTGAESSCLELIRCPVLTSSTCECALMKNLKAAIATCVRSFCGLVNIVGIREHLKLTDGPCMIRSLPVPLVPVQLFSSLMPCFKVPSIIVSIATKNTFVSKTQNSATAMQTVRAQPAHLKRVTHVRPTHLKITHLKIDNNALLAGLSFRKMVLSDKTVTTLLRLEQCRLAWAHLDTSS